MTLDSVSFVSAELTRSLRLELARPLLRDRNLKEVEIKRLAIVTTLPFGLLAG